MGALHQIVYVSTATATVLTPEDLRALLTGSHERNSRAGITGLLLYQNGQFMQVLEGEELAVKTLFGKISRDHRHHGIIPLLQEPVAERQFPNSAMAFRDLDQEAIRRTAGYSEFLDTPLNGALYAKDLPKCRRLLLLFKQNVR